MRRREFIAGALLAALAAANAIAQQAQRVRLVGMLMGIPSEDEEAKSRVAALEGTLAALGWSRGRNLQIEYRWADGGPDHIRAAAQELVALGCEVIVARSTAVASAVARETRSIPIVVAGMSDPVASGLAKSLSRPDGNVTGFVNYDPSLVEKWLELLKAIAPGVSANLTTPVVFLFVSDPIRLGLVDSLPRPGGNYTGVTFSDAFLGAKRLELLTDAIPGIRTVAVLWSPLFQENAALVENIRDAAPKLGIEMATVEIDGVDLLPAAFDQAVAARAQAAIFVTDNALFNHRSTIADLALARRLPTMHTYPPEVRDGGFMSFAPDLGESYRRAAALVDRVLKGTLPRDLPVEEAPSFAEFWDSNGYELPQEPDDGGKLRAFRDDPEGRPLPTPSGKLEIYSERIASFGEADCPGHPVWLGSLYQPDETTPYVLLANQPRTRLHSQFDFGGHSEGAKHRGREVARMHPDDAGVQGIKGGDIIRLSNERGACLAGVVLTERIRRGVVQLPTGAWYDPVDPDEDKPLCVHGNPNVLTRDIGTSALAQGCTGQLTTVRVERFRGNLPPIQAHDPPATRPMKVFVTTARDAS